MGVTDNQNPFGLIPLLNPILGRDLFHFRATNFFFILSVPKTIRKANKSLFFPRKHNIWTVS